MHGDLPPSSDDVTDDEEERKIDEWCSSATNLPLRIVSQSVYIAAGSHTHERLPCEHSKCSMCIRLLLYVRRKECTV